MIAKQKELRLELNDAGRRPRSALAPRCAAWMAMVGFACGGGGDPGPGPLHHHWDEMYIAAVPLSEKQAVFAAQNDYAIARSERAKAQADLTESHTRIQVADNEREQAILGERSALTEKKAAEECGQGVFAPGGNAEKRGGTEGQGAARHRAYLETLLRYTEENVYEKEARFELAKARLAQANKIRPQGFQFGLYETQVAERSRRAQRAKLLAERQKGLAASEQDKWKELNGQVERLRANGRTAQ